MLRHLVVSCSRNLDRPITMLCWTPDTRRRRHQAERIRAWGPLTQSTGPRTWAATRKMFSSFRPNHPVSSTPARTPRPRCSVRSAEMRRPIGPNLAPILFTSFRRKRCFSSIPCPSAAGTAALPGGASHKCSSVKMSGFSKSTGPKTVKEEVNHSSALMVTYVLKASMPHSNRKRKRARRVADTFDQFVPLKSFSPPLAPRSSRPAPCAKTTRISICKTKVAAFNARPSRVPVSP